MIFELIAVACGVLILATLAGMVRNSMVFRYRQRLLVQVFDAIAKDINEGNDWVWRYRAFDAVSYDKMVLQFWRRFDSFYPDRSFLE